MNRAEIDRIVELLDRMGVEVFVDDDFATIAWGTTEQCAVVPYTHDDTQVTHWISTWREPDLTPRGYWMYESRDGVYPLEDPERHDTLMVSEYIDWLRKNVGKSTANTVALRIYKDVCDTVFFCLGK